MNAYLGVMEGAEALWRHNSMVGGFDAGLDAAIQRALSHNAMPIYLPDNDSIEAKAEHLPRVRLIFAKPDPAPVPFLDALDAEALPPMTGPCDRCGTDAVPVARLWLPAGGSIVQVECCLTCRGELHDSVLVWR